MEWKNKWTLLDSMSQRKNVKRFIQSDYPKESIINSIIKSANELAPMKNDIISFHIDIYGPDWLTEKEKLCIQTVCDDEHKELSLKKIKDLYVRETAYFNHQVKAPYLLVYRKKSVDIRDDIAAINAGIHGYAVSLLANRQDIQASFCACFTDKGKTNKILTSKKEMYFMLGLGYAKKRQVLTKQIAELEDITTWH